MNSLQSGIEELQPIIEQIFPVLKEVPVNSISSSISRRDEDNCIYFLIVGDNRLVKPFIEDAKDEAKIKTVLSAVRGYNKVNYDLILDFAFYFKGGGKATFKIGYSSNLAEIQKQYIEALKQVESFRFVIADQERNIHKVLGVDWYYYKNKKAIQKVEKNNYAG